MKASVCGAGSDCTQARSSFACCWLYIQNKYLSLRCFCVGAHFYDSLKAHTGSDKQTDFKKPITNV